MRIETQIGPVALELETAEALFSPREVDAGTLAMLSRTRLTPGQKLLDLGCGYGVVGIWAAKQLGETQVVMLDVDERAVALAQRNARLNGVGGVRTLVSDGFAQLDEKDFDLILSNPPYHADFSVAKGFIEKGFNRLKLGGRLMMVTKRKDWYFNKLAAVFGGARVEEVDGYFVFEAEKRSTQYAGKKKKPRPGGR